MTFQTILILLLLFIILILLKIFHLEQHQRQHYQDLQQQLRHLGSLLEQIQAQLGKLNKLFLPLTEAITRLEKFSNGALKFPVVDERSQTATSTTVLTEAIPVAEGTLKLTLTDPQGLPLSNLKVTFLHTEWSPEFTPENGILVKLLPANRIYEITIETATTGTVIQTQLIQIVPNQLTEINSVLDLNQPPINAPINDVNSAETTITATTLHTETPAPSKPPESPLSSLFTSARDILHSIWSWIIVGEEYRSKTVNIEYAIATTWLLRFGVIAILFASGYFLKYSIVKGYLVPLVKVIIVLLVGLSMLLGGLKLLRSKYYLIGQGLMGGGLAVLYFSIYAAAILYQLISLAAAFIYMTIVTVIVTVLAVRINSLLLALFAIIGGYASPLSLWAGQPALLVSYSYTLLLGLSILFIAHYQQWRLLNYLAFLFNYLIFFNSLLDYQTNDFPLVITFLTLFFILHSSLVYIYNIAKGEKSSLLEIAQLLVNATIYTVITHYLIEETYGSTAPTAWLSISLALFYAAHAYLFIKHRPIDRNLIIALIALTGFYTTWTMPLLFEKESLTLSWSLQAFLFLWIGLKLRSNFIKNLAYLIYLTIVVRLLYFDLPRHFDLFPQVINFSYYLWTLWERFWTFGIAITSILGAVVLLHHPFQTFTQLEIDPLNDTPATLGTNFLESAFYWTGVLFLFLYLQLEFNTLFSYYEPLRLPMLTLLWSGMVMYFLHYYLRTREAMMLKVLLYFLVVTIFKLLVIDLLSWQLTPQLTYGLPYTPLNLSIRLFDFALVMVTLYILWRLLKPRWSSRMLKNDPALTDSTEEIITPHVGTVFGGIGIVSWPALPFILIFIDCLILFIYLSLELNNLLYWKLPDFQTAGISILWAIFAAVYLSVGIWKNFKSLRYLGLSLFMVVISKIFFIDLAQTATLYRVMVFSLVGVALLIGTFVYIYSRQKFIKH